MKAIHAVFENGVFRPTEAVELPDHCEVEVVVTVIKSVKAAETLDSVYAILGQRFDSGDRDVAAKHNEHQP